MDDKLSIVDPEELINTDDGAVDLDAVIIAGIGEAVFRARKIFGEKQVSLEIPDYGIVTVDIPDEDPLVSFDERVRLVVDSSNKLCKATRAPYGLIASMLFVIDGWSWNENVFRSPIWMNDHRDVKIDDARKIEGLEWLTGSSLEIGFAPS